jgi:AAA+ ATPase superfamily predicted ATPase
VRNLKEYGLYKKSVPHAAKLLTKAFPGYSLEASGEILEYYGNLYEELSRLLSENQAEALGYYEQNDLGTWLDVKKVLIKKAGIHGTDENALTVRMAGFLVDWHIIR